MVNIYTNSKLKYPLTDNEYNDIDDVWQLIDLFAKPFIYVTDYRNYLIDIIPKKYDIDKFYYLETIANKLFWNLRWAIFSENKDYDKSAQIIPKSLTQCNDIKYENSTDLIQKLKTIDLNNFYRSFINKLIIIDNPNKTIYYKDMEGSADIFCKNEFNLFTLTVLFNRELYEKVMLSSQSYKKLGIELSHYYYQYDYGFPNLNCCVYDFGDEVTKKNRISKMYYKNGSNNWFKIIK